MAESVKVSSSSDVASTLHIPNKFLYGIATPLRSTNDIAAQRFRAKISSTKRPKAELQVVPLRTTGAVGIISIFRVFFQQISEKDALLVKFSRRTRCSAFNNPFTPKAHSHRQRKREKPDASEHLAASRTRGGTATKAPSVQGHELPFHNSDDLRLTRF